MAGAKKNECGKIPYRDRVSALIAKSEKERRGYKSFRAYPCPGCKQWHLTTLRPDKPKGAVADV